MTLGTKQAWMNDGC